MYNHPPTPDGTSQGDRPGPSASVMELDGSLALVCSAQVHAAAAAIARLDRPVQRA